MITKFSSDSRKYGKMLNEVDEEAKVKMSLFNELIKGEKSARKNSFVSLSDVKERLGAM